LGTLVSRDSITFTGIVPFLTDFADGVHNASVLG
jgi:hypothetical protein